MPRGRSVDLTKRIQQLVEQRQQAVDALASIDETLKLVSSALGSVKSFGRGPRLGAAMETPTARAPKQRRRRRRRHFDITGEESILTFIRQDKKPTTKEINQNWKAEGRGGTADNILTKLFNANLIKRQPLEGERGSRYILA